MNELAHHANAFMLVLIRTSGVVMTAPVFGAAMVPMPVKAAFVLAVSLLLAPTLPAGAAAPAGLAAFGVAALRELGIGLVMGFAAMLVFGAFQVAGGIAGNQMGFTMGELVDPLLEEEETSTLTQFHYVLAMLLFLAINGHHWFLQALQASFREVPLGGMQLTAALGQGLTGRFVELFAAGVKMAAPAICVLTLVTIALAMLARAAPLLNMLMISITLRVAVGLLLMGVLLPYVCRMGSSLFLEMRNDLGLLIRAM